MTEVMDDSLSWEQRREMRRKKRQELIAEADRLVKPTESTTTSSSLSRIARDRAEIDDDDDFEKERQRRRREREERRRREREEFEQQLKEEEEQRSERDRRREERRRLREEAEKGPEEVYTKSVVTKTSDTYDDYGNHEESTETVMETTEIVTEEETPVENGRSSVASSESEEADVANEDVEEDEPETMTTTTTKTITITTKTTSKFEDEEDDVNEVQEKLNALKIKRETTSKKRSTSMDYDETAPEDREARLKQLEEKRKLREQREREEEERNRAEAAKREAEYQEKLRVEREERERRRKEAEAKRQAYRKQLTESDDVEVASPLSPKVLTSPLVSKVEQLNKHITESPKSSKSTPVANVGSLDSRLEKYTKQATKQEVKKTSGIPGRSVNQDVSDRRNRWERGEVNSTSDKASAKRELVTTAGNISSRKNLWESGKVGGSSFKASRKSDDVKGADFSSRKNLWLKATQQESFTKKSESPVGIKTGVSSRLNQWEKGELGSSSPSDKGRGKSDILSASGVVDRRAKWENIGSDTPKTTSQKTTVRVVTAVSDRKNVFESKAAPQDEKDEEDLSASEDQYERDDRSYSSQGDDVESDVDSYDDDDDK